MKRLSVATVNRLSKQRSVCPPHSNNWLRMQESLKPTTCVTTANLTDWAKQELLNALDCGDRHLSFLSLLRLCQIQTTLFARKQKKCRRVRKHTIIVLE